MKRTVVLFIAACLTAACDVRKTGEDTYQVEAPTDAAEQTTAVATQEGQEAIRETSTATQELRRETNQAVQSAEEAARKAAQATGTALEKAGKEIQEHAKPGDQR